jgi:hypothetical protein
LPGGEDADAHTKARKGEGQFFGHGRMQRSPGGPIVRGRADLVAAPVGPLR